MPALQDGARLLATSTQALARMTEELIAKGPSDAASGATPYLRAFSLVVCGWLLGRQVEALGLREDDTAFATAKSATAHFFLTQLLPEVFALEHQVGRGAEALFAVPGSQLAV